MHGRGVPCLEAAITAKAKTKVLWEAQIYFLELESSLLQKSEYKDGWVVNNILSHSLLPLKYVV